ncbi:hypothetical protein Tco_1503661 [Tanacetum coccineum]
MVGESSSKSKFHHKNKGKNGGRFGQNHSKDGKKDYTQKNKYNFKKVYYCWVCRKPGNKAKDCCHKKEHGGENSEGNFNEANHVESPKEFTGVIESFLTTNVVDRWFDTGYLDEGLFKISVVTDDNVINNENIGTSTTSVYMIDPSFLWHSRLGHVNFHDLMIMGINMNVINQTKKMLHSSFDMKDMEESVVILGKSISGYVFTLGGADVSWKSSKQTVNTKSIMEAEFIALEKAVEEAEGIPLWLKHVTVVCIHYDSVAALTKAKNHL